MRLGTCIALELAVAIGGVAGVWLGVGHLASSAGDYFTTREASAAVATPIRSTTLTALPRSELAAAPAAIKPKPPENVFGAPDAELLAPIGTTKVMKVKLNHGGTSLSLRLEFETGARAAFKPEQIHQQSDPRRELAAYRIDRLLGIGHVPPARPVSIPLPELIAAIEPGFRSYVAERITDEAIVRKGVVHGELSWWIPEIKVARLGREKIDEHEGKKAWIAALQVGAKIPPETAPFVTQIATCVLFDLLIDNADRWSGGNTMMSPDGKILFFMDNTLAFSRNQLGHHRNALNLRRLQVFPRKLIGKLRTLTLESITATLEAGGDSGLGRLLHPTEVSAIISRRDHILRHVDSLIEKFGEDAVLALP